MKEIFALVLEYKEIVFLALGLILLALFVKLIVKTIDTKTQTEIIEVTPTIILSIKLYEDGSETLEYSYIKEFISLNKIPKKVSVADFFNYLPKDIVINYEYEIKYISNNNETSKRVGTTTNIEEIEDQILNLKKYH